jgi:N-acyl-D-amino-acid deacylase
MLIKGARVIDGTGATGFLADVAIEDGRIASVAAPGVAVSAREVIDATGLVLAPGFIDVHTHDDLALIQTPAMLSKVSQGVTSVVTGLCGYSPAPLAPEITLPAEYDILLPRGARTYARFATFLERVRDARPAVNWLPLVGHSTLRLASMDRLDRPADARELEAMAEALDQALDDGAAGLSSGLAYAMAREAMTDELIHLCGRLATRGAPYVTHVRDEGDGLIAGVAEALEIGRAAGVPVILSHHKAIGARNHGRTMETLTMIDAANRNQPVALDVYPYAYSSTALTPERAARDGEIIITRSDTMPEAVGLSLDRVAERLGCDRVEAARRIHPAGALFHSMAEADVRRVLAHPLTMIGSDGLPFDPRPHPRLWGTFPRVLGHYARDEGVLSLELAVHKMTGLPAHIFGLQDRGVIAPGYHADLVLFDPAAIADIATPDDPTALAIGIVQVWVNGASAGTGAGRRLVPTLRAVELGVGAP